MAQRKPFDASDPRCKYPKFGKHFDEVLGRSRYRGAALPLARDTGLTPEIIRGYRRGHGRPSVETVAKLSKFLLEPVFPTDYLEGRAAMPETFNLRGDIQIKLDGDFVIFSTRLSKAQFNEMVSRVA